MVKIYFLPCRHQHTASVCRNQEPDLPCLALGHRDYSCHPGVKCAWISHYNLRMLASASFSLSLYAILKLGYFAFFNHSCVISWA